MSRYDWMADAACTQADPDLFHPGGNGVYTAAEKVCANCPVQQHCADHARRIEGTVTHPYRHGMWAGNTPRARAQQAATPARARRDADIVRLAAKGWKPEAIADHVGCSDRTVWRVLEAHRNQLEEAA